MFQPNPYGLPDINTHWRMRGHIAEHGFRVYAIDETQAFDLHTGQVVNELVIVLVNVTSPNMRPAQVFASDFRKLFVEGAQA